MSNIKRVPDFQGVGRAWEMKVGKQARPDQEATLIGYIINGPWHLLWSWWMVAVIHLREIPGVKPPNKRYPGAEYEFMIISIDPDVPPNPDKTFPQDVKYLTPIDVVYQFDGVTDEQAKEICTTAVKVIIKGMSPDQDYRSWWENSIAKTVEHYKAGVH